MTNRLYAILALATACGLALFPYATAQTAGTLGELAQGATQTGTIGNTANAYGDRVEKTLGDVAPTTQEEDAIIEITNETDDPVLDLVPVNPIPDPCKMALDELSGGGTTQSTQYDGGFYNREYDALDNTPQCQRLRDNVLHEVYENTGAPPVSYCRKVNNMNYCVGANQVDCDVTTLLAGGLIRLCVGGTNPYN